MNDDHSYRLTRATVTGVTGYFALSLYVLLRYLPFSSFGAHAFNHPFVFGMGFGLVLLAAAILAWFERQEIDAVVFLLAAIAALPPLTLIATRSVLWFFVLVLALGLVAWKTGGRARAVFLLLLALTLALRSFGRIFGSVALVRAGADAGLLAAAVGLYYAVGLLLRADAAKGCLPYV